jgi:hypothetical protein
MRIRAHVYIHTYIHLDACTTSCAFPLQMLRWRGASSMVHWKFEDGCYMFRELRRLQGDRWAYIHSSRCVCVDGADAFGHGMMIQLHTWCFPSHSCSVVSPSIAVECMYHKSEDKMDAHPLHSRSMCIPRKRSLGHGKPSYWSRFSLEPACMQSKICTRAGKKPRAERCSPRPHLRELTALRAHPRCGRTADEGRHGAHARRSSPQQDTPPPHRQG